MKPQTVALGCCLQSRHTGRAKKVVPKSLANNLSIVKVIFVIFCRVLNVYITTSLLSFI